MRKMLMLAVALFAAAALAGKGNGGGGSGNNTPPDILFLVDLSQFRVLQDDGSGEAFLVNGNGRASWSPDGTEVAFCGDADGPGIYVVALGGGQPRKVVATNTPLSWTHFVAWSPAPTPDGEYKIAFSDAPLRPDGTFARDEVFLVNLDGTGLEDASQLDGVNARAREISWSPDAKQVAFLFGNSIRVLDLARRDAAGLPALDTVYSSSTLTPSQAEWAKTSDRIAFSALDRSLSNAMLDLYVIEVAFSATLDAWTASDPVNITETPNDEETSPSWSPDDGRIVCMSTHWGAKSGKGTTTMAIVPVGSGTRQTLRGQDRSYCNFPVWKRSTP